MTPVPGNWDYLRLPSCLRAERLAAAYERLREAAMVLRYRGGAVQNALEDIERIEKEKP